MKNKYQKIICLFVVFSVMCASFPISVFASNADIDKEALAEIAFLQSELRKNAPDMSMSKEAFDRYVLDLQCLNRLTAKPGFSSMSEEDVIILVRECSRRYRQHKKNSKTMLGVGAISWIIGKMLVENNALNTFPSYIGKGCVAFGTSMLVMGFLFNLIMEPQIASAGPLPGGFGYLQRLKQNPVLFEDEFQAHKLLESKWNADGSVSRYLQNYKMYLQNMRNIRFVLELGEIEAEYNAWAQVNGIGADSPDMMKYMEIASRYPLDAREKQMRDIQRARVLRQVQKSIEEQAGYSFAGI